MAKNIELEQLIINKLTQEQFDSIEEKNPSELYFITDAEDDGGKGAQVEEMPEATEMNAGQIVQYVGETIPDVETTATITQTVGDSLTDLKVDAEKFGKASGLTESGSVEFYTTGSETKFVSDELPTDNNQGLTVKIDSDKFFDWLFKFYDIDINTISQVMIECVVNNDSSISNWGINVYFDNDTSIILMEHLTELPEDSGISYEVAGLDNFNIWCRAYFQIAPKNAEWFVNNQVIDVNQYGITYSGTPSNGDTLKVEYTPFVGGYEKGYFYVNQAILSEPTVTIEQTVGTSLSNLSIDADKFIEAEQPAGDCSVEFKANVEKDYGNVTISAGVGEWIITVSAEDFYNTFVEQYGSFSDWQYSGFIVYYSGNFCFEGQEHPDDGGIWFSLSKEELEARGFQFSTDSLQELDYNTYAYIAGAPDTVVWLKKDTEVDIANYGIYYSGAVNQNDIITVNYIAPKFVCYNWNQINVQPAAKGNGGIEWVTKLDLPADYPESYRWNCHPIWTISGGVPDGTYEFYVQSLCGTNWEPERVGVQNYTVKVLVKFYTKDNIQYHFGSVSYVVDGTWTGDDNFKPTHFTIHNSFKTGNNNLYFWYSGYPFYSSLPGYVGAVAIPGIFKMSAWKNIDSGETYIPEGMLYTGSQPYYEIAIEGYLDSQPLCPPVDYPSFYRKYTNVNIKGNSQYALISPEYIFNDGTSSKASAQSATFDIKSESGGTFYATTTNKNGSCVVQELESSGDLKNVQLGVGDDGKSYIYFNNNDLSRVEVLFSLTGMRNTENSAGVTFASWVNPSSFTPLTIERVGAPITTLNLGKILQYTQESTDEYTKGYFYKASGTLIKTPASMEVTRQSIDGVEILIDAEKLAQAICSYTGWSTSHVKNDLLRYNHYYVYYENEGSPYVHVDFYGDFWDSSIVECFTINGELPDRYIDFDAGNYKDSTIEVIDGKWEQVNVQPASNTVQVTEMPEASEENVGKILQYVGTPTSEYDQGYFYKCTADGWVQVNVQPASGGGGEAPSELPNLTGNEGRFLSNNGSELEWADIPTSLPTQEGHSGKYLTTDGENASWVEIELPESTDGVELPDQTGNSGKFLTTDGANLSWAEVSSGGGTVTGDYLPLSGGTLTGALKLHENFGDSDIALEALNYGAEGGTVLKISGGTIVADSIHPSGQYSSLGTPYDQTVVDMGGYGGEGLYYQRVCAKALNNGTYQDDIIIPDKSGTLALIEDIEAVMGDLSSALDTINGEEI